MPITIDGDGTITGVSVGGLPDGIVDADMLASSAVTTAKINDDAVTDAKQNLSGAAKAWANFNGAGTVSIRTSFNFASITDNGTGDYTLTFTTALTDANYCVVTGTNDSGVPKRAVVLYVESTPVNSSVRLASFRSTTGELVDEDIISVAVFR